MLKYYICYTIISFLHAINLNKSYSYDKGKLRAQKIANAICIYIIITMNFTSILTLGWCFANADKIFENNYVDKWFFPAFVTLSNFFISNILGIIAISVCLGLSRRQEASRKIIIYIIPLICFSELLTSLEELADLHCDLNNYIKISLITSIIYITVYASIYVFYTRKNVINGLFEKGAGR